MISNPETEWLNGYVERVTFHNPDNGFAVLRIKNKKQRDLLTVVGTVATVNPGEMLNCRGVWLNDKLHGMQFRAEYIKVVPPDSLEGVEKYLASGLIKGIGPHFAKQLVRAFGMAVFDIIEQQPKKLLTIEGIGEKRLEAVLAAWHEQKAIRNIMVFLQGHGVGTARAVRIYKTYGDDAVKIVEENPYRLAKDIFGIGFKTADLLAERLGFLKDSHQRARAGLDHVLQKLCDDGHCAVEPARLLEAASKLLEIDTTILDAALTSSLKAGDLILEEKHEPQCIYLPALYYAETQAAKQLLILLKGSLPWGHIDFSKAVDWVETQHGMKLSASQSQALHWVFSNKISVITGGPGVGKTTLVKSIIMLLQAKKNRIALCSPTGRAAKRLSETTGLEAKTIHRLLSFNPKTRGFQFNQQNRLTTDVIIIDEASMLDIVIFNNLLKAIPNHAAVIFVGDCDQLPSVGAGAVLKDVINSGSINVVKLTEIFRQAETSQIIVNAHRINAGKMPLPHDNKDADFYSIYVDDPEVMQQQIVQIVSQRLPKYLNCDPIKDIQVLTPMNRGGLGSRGLNAILQQALNGTQLVSVTRYGVTYAVGDKVIQLVNNYDKDVFNGDLGWIIAIDTEEQVMIIEFDGQARPYDFNELDEISLAYAISIHKSQGSEFPIVVLPIAMQHFTLLARNLLYTGITRGKKMVVLIGQKKAIGMAVKQNKIATRLTCLAARLQEAEPQIIS